jgi:hypothetical protein
MNRKVIKKRSPRRISRAGHRQQNGNDDRQSGNKHDFVSGDTKQCAVTDAISSRTDTVSRSRAKPVRGSMNGLVQRHRHVCGRHSATTAVSHAPVRSRSPFGEQPIRITTENVWCGRVMRLRAFQK